MKNIRAGCAILSLYLTAVLILFNCSGYSFESQTYDISAVACNENEPIDEADYRDDFITRAKLTISNTPDSERDSTEEAVPSVGPGPYRFDFILTDGTNEAPKDFTIQSFKITSTIGTQNYDMSEMLLPAVISPDSNIISITKKLSKEKGWACNSSDPADPKNLVCYYAFYFHLFPQSFDFRWDNDEVLLIEMGIVDTNRDYSGNICYQAIPVSRTIRRNYSIGV